MPTSLHYPAFWRQIILTLPLAFILAWYPSYSFLAPLALPALALWYVIVLSYDTTDRWALCLGFYFILFVLTSYWLSECLVTFVGLSFPVSLLALIPLFGLAAFLATVPIIAGLNPRIPGSIAAWVMLFEYLRQATFMASPWFWLANIAVDTPFLSPCIPLGGQFLATYLVCLTALLAAFALTKQDTDYLYLLALVVGLCLLSGLIFQPSLSSSHASIPLRIVQGNVPTATKNHADTTWQTYASLVAGSQDTSALYVLPEGVLSYAVQERSDLLRLHETTTLKNSIIGTNLWIDRFYPSLITTGQAEGLYHKNRFVPFGETNPFSFLFPPSLKEQYPFLNALEPSPSPTPLRFSDTQIFPFLCYELFFSPPEKALLSQSGLLLVSAENTWYGHSVINDYFLLAARFRAIESNRPLVLALNRGPSVVVNDNGTITHKLAYDQQGLLSARVATKNSVTLYHILPDSVILLSLIVLDILLFLGLQHGYFRHLFCSKHREARTSLLGS